MIDHILKDRTAMIWDFDGVLYSYHYNDIAPEDLEKNFFSANAKGAQEIIPDLSDEEAYHLGGQGFLQYHDTVTAFLPYAKQTGMDEADFKKQVLIAQLKWSFKNISENIPQLIAPCAETNDLFAALKPYIKHAMITHANAEYWAHPVSRNLGVEDYFDHIMGYDDFDFKSKGQSAYAVELALKKLGVNADKAIFIEDQPKHLEVAKAAFPELCTVFIEGKTAIEKPDYVDIMVQRPKNFMKHLLSAHKNARSAA